jgi:hypothetical protein
MGPGMMMQGPMQGMRPGMMQGMMPGHPGMHQQMGSRPPPPEYGMTPQVGQPPNHPLHTSLSIFGILLFGPWVLDIPS